MRSALKVGLGGRASIPMQVITREGTKYYLGKTVEGDDIVARFYQWDQKRRIGKYCRQRLKQLTGVEREDFKREMEARRG